LQVVAGVVVIVVAFVDVALAAYPTLDLHSYKATSSEPNDPPMLISVEDVPGLNGGQCK